MVDNIQGGGSISPESKALYKQEYERAVNLFQQSLTGYQKSDEPHQKAKFQDVMNRALQIMHETIKEALGQGAQKQQAKLDQDYQNFLTNSNPNTAATLNQDIENLKKLS